MDWTPLVVKDLVELILRLFILLTTRGAIHGTNSIVRLVFERGIPLVTGPSSVVVTLPVIIVVTTREAAALFLLFVCPALHHIA